MPRRSRQRESVRLGSAPTAGSRRFLQVAPIACVSDCGGDTVSIGSDVSAATDLHVVIVILGDSDHLAVVLLYGDLDATLARPAPTTTASNYAHFRSLLLSGLGLC